MLTNAPETVWVLPALSRVMALEISKTLPVESSPTPPLKVCEYEMLAISDVKAVEPVAPVLDKVRSSPLNAVAVEVMSRAVPVVSPSAERATPVFVVIESPVRLNMLPVPDCVTARPVCASFLT